MGGGGCTCQIWKHIFGQQITLQKRNLDVFVRLNHFAKQVVYSPTRVMHLPFVVTFCYILTLCYIITLLCKLSNVVTLLHCNILLHHHYVTLEIEQCILAPASLHYLSHYSLYCTFQKQPTHVISEHHLHTLSHPALRPNLKYLLTLFRSNRRWGVGEGMSWQN